MSTLRAFTIIPVSFVFLSCISTGNDKKGDKISTPASLTKVGQMASEVKESSGLAPAGVPGTFYTHGDAGTGAVLFKINKEGKLLGKVKLPVPNKDWESLSYDNEGNILVCDCGNNDNNRKDLVVYRVNPASPDKVSEIKFSYPDQQDFPPKKKERNFDSEGSLWHNGQIYLFSRDRGRQQTSKVYTIPAEPGNHVATKVTELKIDGEVTSASLSPDGKTMALLTKESLLIYSGSGMADILKATPKIISTKGAGQTEGSEFIDNQNLLISTEEGVLYQYKL